MQKNLNLFVLFYRRKEEWESYQIDRFLKRLKKDQINVVQIEFIEEKYLLKQSLRAASESILIAQEQSILELGKETETATIGVQSFGADASWLNADMVLESFEEIDAQFLKRIYERKHGIPWKIAETKRCIIREQVIEDLPALEEIYADEKFRRFIEDLYPHEEEAAFMKAYIASQYPFYGYGLWSIVEKNSGKLIGRAGLSQREIDGKMEIELGYEIGCAYQNRGFATEICREILVYGRNYYEMKKIHCFIVKENEESVRLAQKLGFLEIEPCYIEETEHRHFILFLD